MHTGLIFCVAFLVFLSAGLTSDTTQSKVSQHIATTSWPLIVIPIYKRGSKNSGKPSSYLIECWRVSEAAEQLNVLPEEQFGFRSGRGLLGSMKNAHATDGRARTWRVHLWDETLIAKFHDFHFPLACSDDAILLLEQTFSISVERVCRKVAWWEVESLRSVLSHRSSTRYIRQIQQTFWN